jgi:glycosyltransferase involved in cell wall biosynthesis
MFKIHRPEKFYQATLNQIRYFKMTHICHISGTTSLGGGPEHLFQLLKHCDKDHFSSIICTRQDGPYWKKFQQLGIPLHPFTLRELSLSSFISLYRFLKTKRPQLIHTHGKGPGLYGRIIGKILGIPTIHTFHGFHYDDIQPLKRSLHLLIEDILCRLTDHHVFVGKTEKKRAGIISSLNEKNSSVIHNGVDSESIQSLQVDKTKLLRDTGLEHFSKKKILGVISRISPEKGISQLLERFAETRALQPEWKLVIVGGFPEEHKEYKKKILQLISDLKLEPDIALPGFREDAMQFLKCFDLYISPSLSEGLPLALLEAICAKTPVIASNIPGNREVLGDPPCGLIFSPETPHSLSAALNEYDKLSANDIDQLKKQASLRVATEFSALEMAKKTYSLYQKVLNSK